MKTCWGEQVSNVTRVLGDNFTENIPAGDPGSMEVDVQDVNNFKWVMSQIYSVIGSKTVTVVSSRKRDQEVR